MGLFENFPYTNYQDLNLDFIARRYKKLEVDFAELLHTVNNKLDEMETQISTILQYKYFITPEDYGAIGDGVTDDYESIQRCLTENKGKLIIFKPKSNYLISQTLVLDSFNICLLNLNNATIKVSDDFIGTYAFTIRGVGTGEVPIYNGFIKNLHGITNGNIDCNDIACGIYCEGGQFLCLSDLNIYNCDYIGIRMVKNPASGYYSADNYFNKINILGKPFNIDSIAYDIDTHDGNFANLRCKNFETGIKVSGSGNTFITSHPFLSSDSRAIDEERYSLTIGIDVSGRYNSFTNMYIDNFATGIKIAGDSNLFYNTTYYRYCNYNIVSNIISLVSNNAYSLFDGLIFGNAKSGNYTKIIDYANFYTQQIMPVIKNIKYTPSTIQTMLPSGFDLAFSTQANDRKNFIIRNHLSATIAADSHIPLFLLPKMPVGTAKILLGIGNLYLAEMLITPNATNPIQIKSLNIPETYNYGTVQLEEVVFNNADYYQISLSNTAQISFITVDSINCEIIPFIGSFDLSVPLEYSLLFTTNLNNRSGFVAFPTTTAHGNGYIYENELKCPVLINNESYTQNSTYVIAEFRKTVKPYKIAIVQHETNFAIVPISYADNNLGNTEMSIVSPYSGDTGTIAIFVL